MPENIFQLYPQVWMIYLMNAVYLVLTALWLVSMWFILVKMGKPGWYGIIPYFDLWAVTKYTGRPIARFWALAGSMLLMMLAVAALLGHLFGAAVAGQIPSEGFSIACVSIACAAMVAAIVFGVLISHGLSRCFGHGGWFTAGLVLLPFIFFPVLAFGDSEFTAPEEKKPVPVSVPEPETAEESPDESAEGSE